jgi:hypothetical protein
LAKSFFVFLQNLEPIFSLAAGLGGSKGEIFHNSSQLYPKFGRSLILEERKKEETPKLIND